MLLLTRLNGHPMAINGDLIKSIESSPDTMITLITGEKIVVREALEQVVEVAHFGASNYYALRWLKEVRQQKKRNKPQLVTQLHRLGSRIKLFPIMREKTTTNNSAVLA